MLRQLVAKDQHKAETFCKKIYRVLGIKDYGRIDLRMKEDGRLYFLEANANPDLSLGDELAEAWEQRGGNYEGLIASILHQARKRARNG